MYIFLFAIEIALVLVIVFLCILFVSFFTGGPYVRTRRRVRKNIVSFADLRAGNIVLDLGSGDAVILRVLAKHGIYGIGWEINPFLVIFSRIINFFGKKSRHCIRIEHKNFWTHPFPKVDAVILYTLPDTLKKLEEKLRTELSRDTKIIAVDFHFPHLKLLKQGKRLALYQL